MYKMQEQITREQRKERLELSVEESDRLIKEKESIIVVLQQLSDTNKEHDLNSKLYPAIGSLGEEIEILQDERQSDERALAFI